MTTEHVETAEYYDRVYIVTLSTSPDVEVGTSDISRAIYQGIEGIDTQDAILVERQS